MCGRMVPANDHPKASGQPRRLNQERSWEPTASASVPRHRQERQQVQPRHLAAQAVTILARHNDLPLRCLLKQMSRNFPRIGLVEVYFGPLPHARILTLAGRREKCTKEKA